MKLGWPGPTVEALTWDFGQHFGDSMPNSPWQTGAETVKTAEWTGRDKQPRKLHILSPKLLSPKLCPRNSRLSFDFSDTHRMHEKHTETAS